MIRFRYSGINWEGRPWNASAAIVALGQQVEALYPARSGIDGTVASQDHDATSPFSDHRPHPYSGVGTVRAIDIGGNEEVDDLVEDIRLSRDKRVRYVIRYGRIFTSYPVGSRPAWQWGEYSGSNPHKTHAHVSVLASADKDATLWSIGDDMPLTNDDIRRFWEYGVPDEDDGLGTRGAVHALRQAWGFARKAALDAAQARAEIAVLRQELAAAGGATPIDIDALADAVRAKFTEQPLR
jgi:hypothetical protein